MFNLYKGPVKLVLFDVDGVLTDGQLHINDNGELFKSFNAKDGVAIALLKAHGILSGIISGKDSPALDFRAKQLALDIKITGCHNKLAALSQVCDKLLIDPSMIAFVGDDIIDLSIMQSCGFSYAPADAHSLIKKAASHVTIANGGFGVAREVAEHILSQGGLDTENAYAPLIKNWTDSYVQQ